MLVAFEQIQILGVVGPAEILDAATQVLGGNAGYELSIATLDGKPVRCSSGMRLQADDVLPHVKPRSVDTLIVGGSMHFERAAADPRLRTAIRRISHSARRTCSVCTGAFLLGAAGLLDGRSATTHWAFSAELARRHPSIQVTPDRIFVRDGRITTSAGATAGMDLALALIEEDHGAEIARAVARWTVMFHHRAGRQSQLSERLAIPDGAHASLRGGARSHRRRACRRPPPRRARERASLSERHFRRIFVDQTGITPGRFIERIRVEAAREMLERTTAPLDAVAAHCGFGSPETMRRAFLRVAGVGPSDHRARSRSNSASALDA